jgi:hypothetical protein
MGESQNDPLRLDFNRQLKLEFHGSTVTSDAELLTYRELDDALTLTCTGETGLHETRTGQNTQHSLLALLRQSVYSRLAGYEDVNDAGAAGRALTRRVLTKDFRVLRSISSSFPKLCLTQSHRP